MNLRYITATNDGFQHLVESSDYFTTLCGMALSRSIQLSVYDKALPGMTLCADCKEQRDVIKRDEAAKKKKVQAEAAKYFWFRPTKEK